MQILNMLESSFVYGVNDGTPLSVAVNNGEPAIACKFTLKQKQDVAFQIVDPPGFIDGLKVHAVLDGVQPKNDSPAHGFILRGTALEAGDHTVVCTFFTDKDGPAAGAVSSPIGFEFVPTPVHEGRTTTPAAPPIRTK